MTLREAWEAIYCETFDGRNGGDPEWKNLDGTEADAVSRFLKAYGDATLYRSCPECGDERVVPKPYGDERDRGRTFSDCPACKDTPISIVTAEVLERAMEAAAQVSGATTGSKLAYAIVDAVLSVVLGPVRVASGVGRVVQVSGPVVVQPDDKPNEAGLLRAGVTIAILNNEGEED